MNDEVSVRANGVDLKGWTDVSITAGITMAARTFSVGITFSWPQAKDVLTAVNLGDKVEVLIGSDTVLTGYIFSSPISYSGQSVTVLITGRSKTADIIDCCPIASAITKPAASSRDGWAGAGAVPATGSQSAPETPAVSQWKDKSIEQIAADICQPYGVDVIAEASTGDPISLHAIENGETCFESISRLLTVGQLFAMDDEAGRLVLTEPGATGICSGGLELGVNILRGSMDRDASGIFSDYVVEGQRAGTDDSFGADASHLNAESLDAESSRYRLIVLPQSGAMTSDLCRQIAQFEQRRRRALLQAVSYEVAGWRDASGRLWRPNTQVHVKDSLFGIDDLLLIAEVTYSLSSSGMLTRLNLAPIDAFKATPTAQQEAQAQETGGGSSWMDQVK